MNCVNAEDYVKTVHTRNTQCLPLHRHTSTTLSTSLGNIRLSYGRDPETNEVAILKESHYYPFGLQHNGYASTHRTTGVIKGIGGSLRVG